MQNQVILVIADLKSPDAGVSVKFREKFGRPHA